jgi:hypothetical protein
VYRKKICTGRNRVVDEIGTMNELERGGYRHTTRHTKEKQPAPSPLTVDAPALRLAAPPVPNVATVPAVTVTNTVKENASYFSPQEVKVAVAARELIHALGDPSDRTVTAIINHGVFNLLSQFKSL